MPQQANFSPRFLFRAGRLEELKQGLALRLAHNSGDGEAWFWSARVYYIEKQYKVAVAAFQTAATLLPDPSDALIGVAASLICCDNRTGAEGYFRRVLKQNPKLSQVWFLAAENNFARGDFLRCQLDAQQATTLAPRHSAAWQLLGDACHQLGRLPEAAFAYETALAGMPASHELLNNLGTVRYSLGLLSEAYRCYRKALSLAPQNATIRNNLGVILRQQGQPTKAAACFSAALTSNPQYAQAHRNLGNTLQDLGQHQAAIDCYRKALQLEPDFVDAYNGLLFCLTHDEATSPAELYAAHCAFGDRFEHKLATCRQPHQNSRVADRQIRLGFVSADLRQHPVANFIGPIWQHLNRTEFEIFVYANQTVADEETAQLKARVDHWRTVAALSDEALCDCIRRDEIDILFDLSGHTAGNRLLIFARKPAPIQISWIGYPNTTGLSSIDYRLVDAFVAPHGLLDEQFSEKLLYLPSAGTFENCDEAPAVNPLPALSSGQLTFASFHRNNKLGDGAIGLWSRILTALPEARMLIGACGDTNLQESLKQRFGQFGIASDRITFRAKVGMLEYLALHHEVDIHLDSFPFTSGTTANHALWMGVPTLTLAGPTMPQRLSAAHLGRVGLHDWVAQTQDDYLAKAVHWAGDLGRLAALRATLRTQVENSPFRQASTVTRGLEAALRQVWQHWCGESPPVSFVDPNQEEGP